MEFRELGTSGFRISVLGLGTWVIGGASWEYGWGPQDDVESLAALERAVDEGMNWIDTAPAYGLGHAEELVGQVLLKVPRSRRPLVFTKGSLVWGLDRRISHSLDPASLTREVDASLARLGVDVIDLYQIHWPSFPAGGPDDGIEAALTRLDELKRDGKLRAIGVSNFDVPQLERARSITQIASLQPPYSALMRGIEDEILPYCARHNIGVIGYSPLQSGLLTGTMTRERIASFAANDWRRRSVEFNEPRLGKTLDLVELFRVIGERHGVSAAVVAVAWTLRDASLTGAIVGARRPSQLDGLMPAGSFRLSESEIAEIAKLLPASSDMIVIGPD